jgi:hypothetical protein
MSQEDTLTTCRTRLAGTNLQSNHRLKRQLDCIRRYNNDGRAIIIDGDVYYPIPPYFLNSYCKGMSKRNQVDQYGWRVYRFAFGSVSTCQKQDVTDPDSVFNNMVWDKENEDFARVLYHTESCLEGGVRGFVTLFDEVTKRECTISVNKLRAWLMVGKDDRHPYPFCTCEHPHGTTQLYTSTHEHTRAHTSTTPAKLLPRDFPSEPRRS